MNQIIYGDCLDIIELLDDDSVDCCITDPPYGIKYQSAWRIDRSKWKPIIKNDDAPFVDWVLPIYRKMKDGGRLLCFYRWDVQDAFLDAIIDAGFNVKSQIVWDKVVHGMGDLKGEFAPTHELILYATKGRYEFVDNRPKSIYRVQRVNPEKMIHPNEKPIELLKKLIIDITLPGELIVDPFGGSFSTYMASISCGRYCVSCELHPEYFELGTRRVKMAAIDDSYF